MEGILLGYEVGSCAEVRIPLRHTAIFGMTQLSGKTTTLEAIITRSGLRAVAFITKRGEGGFKQGNRLTPFYRPRADWQYVEGLINVALNERVKYEPGMRGAIMQACRKASDLDDIRKAAREMSSTARGEFMKSVYDRLAAYLDIVVPELAKWTFSRTLELQPGVNVMDIAEMRTETQHIVMASAIEEINRAFDHVVVVVPEAWETLPQSRMTPVKWVAQQFIRKGAALGNFMFLDSQDIGGIDKTPLRQVDNWLLGRMREAHEVERFLKQVVGAKVAADEVATLAIGHFIAVIGNEVKRVYVLPVGVPEEAGVKVALGEISPQDVAAQYLVKKESEGEDMALKEENDNLKKRNAELEDELKRISQQSSKAISERAEMEDKIKGLSLDDIKDMQLVRDLRSMLRSFLNVSGSPGLAPDPSVALPFDPPGMGIKYQETIVAISHETQPVNFTTSNVQGKIIFCGLKDLAKEGFTMSELSEALKERGWNIGNNTLSPTLGHLVKNGTLVTVENVKPTRYRFPGKLTINVSESEPSK